MNYPSRYKLILGLVLMLCLLGASPLHAVTLLNDTFTDGTNPGWTTTANNYVAIGGPPTVETTGTGLTGNALDYDAGSNRFLIRSLSNSVNLGVGDSITLSFDFRFKSDPPDAQVSFTFGLYDSTTPGSETGYSARISPGGTANSRIVTVSSGNVNPLFQGFNAMDDAHSAVFTIERTSATALDITLQIDGGSAINVTRTDDPFEGTIFNGAFIGNTSGSTSEYYIDNVLVTSTVPEPGALGLAVPGFLMLNFLRRRSRRS